jgi:hypothetical protein
LTSNLLQSALQAGAEQMLTGCSAAGVDEVALDPVAWCREAQPQIESKRRGLIPFVPHDYQADIMRRLAGLEMGPGGLRPRAGGFEDGVVDKARQVGVTTCIMVALAHQLLYRYEARRQPLHAHVIANKETVAIGSLLKKAKTALQTAKKTPAQARGLRGIDPRTKNVEIAYYAPGAQNQIVAHAAAPDVGRSFDGNFVFMDEVTHMAFAEEIYGGLATMLDDAEGALWLVSTYHGDGDFFCDMVDNAAALGLTHLALDWRVIPGRDAVWRAAQLKKFKGREYIWLEENELERFTSGEQALNMALVKELDQLHPWIGSAPNSTHRYSKGVDLAGRGGDATVFCVVDILTRPAQVVYCEEHRRLSTPKKAEAIARLDATWPGPLWIDGTNDNTMPSNVKLLLAPGHKLTAVHLSGGMDPRGRDYRDRDNGIQWSSRPRAALESSLVGNLEHGRLTVHLDAFPEIRVALGTWHQETGGKRKGRNVDWLDALLLANMSLTKIRASADTQRVVEIPNTGPLRNLRRRW